MSTEELSAPILWQDKYPQGPGYHKPWNELTSQEQDSWFNNFTNNKPVPLRYAVLIHENLHRFYGLDKDNPIVLQLWNELVKQRT